MVTRRVVHRRRSIIHEFCSNTTAHALPAIARSENRWNRLFWSITFLIFFGVMIFFVVQSIREYFHYETTIDNSFETDEPAYFPAISLCNISPFRLDQIVEPLINFTNSQFQTNFTLTNPIDPIVISRIDDFLIDQLNRNQSLKSYSFSLASMLFSCSFNGQLCSEKNFTTFISAAYGLCFTFNAKLKNVDGGGIRVGTTLGNSGVFNLNLYIHQQQYVPYLTTSAGVVISVHDNEAMPSMESFSIELSPGRQHRLGCRKKVTKILPSPYGQCSNENQVLTEIVSDNYENTNYSYSYSICRQICLQTFIYDQCGCVSFILWNMRKVLLNNTNQYIVAPLCPMNDTCVDSARLKLIESPSLLETFCEKCPTSCVVTEYTVQPSSSLAPLDWELTKIKTFVEKTKIPLKTNWSNEWRNEIRKNYLSIRIVRETNIVDTSSQKSVLSFIDLISNVGGHTGLWIGISFLSIIEVFEMIFRLIQNEVHLNNCSINRINR